MRGARQQEPLHLAVQEYLNQERARFHIPGHKGNSGPGLEWDITEVEGCDSLYNPQGPILALEKQLAKLYGARRTLLSAGGGTLCVQAMLALACRPGQKLVASRGLHSSAVNTMALLDLEPVWIYPDDSAGPWFAGRYTPQAVEEALKACPDAAAVYITSPDYFGVISDIQGISQVCKARGVPLLVDNAHGSHLKFMPDDLKLSHPIDCGASICCDSMHKTLPAMTGGALLHIADERYLADAKERMALFGSTSPSYPILLSCEEAASYAACGQAKRDYRWATEAVFRIGDRLRAMGMAMPEGVCDPARLSVAFGSQGWTGQQVGEYLRQRKVEPEYVSQTACVLMAGGYNRLGDLVRLQNAVREIPQGKPTPPPSMEMPRLERACSIREAVFAPGKSVTVRRAAGRVVAQVVVPCPPGVPVVMPGERLDKEAAALLAARGIQRIRVMEG